MRQLGASVVTVRKPDGSVKGTITYAYSAAGEKIQKITEEIGAVVNGSISNVTTSILYLPSGVVYETKQYSNASLAFLQKFLELQFLGHEEGRIRFKPTLGSTPASFQYDYFIKDHLGNVRMVLTEEKKDDIYPALSFEGAVSSPEVVNQNAIWEKADGTSFDVVNKRTSVQQLVNATSLNPPTLTNSLLVRSSTGKIGAGKLLKVMSGDKIHTTVQFYFSQNTSGGTTSGLNTLLSGLSLLLTNSIGSSALLKSNPTAVGSALSVDQNAINYFNSQSSPSNNGKPKAFLNVLFFDEQFKFDNTSSYSEQIGIGSVTNPGQIVIALASAKSAKKNGYCYIYISNETNDMVHFDNLTLTHEKSAIIEETHYYPFGLTMAGISSRASGSLENKNQKFQGQEFTDDFSLSMYEFKYRMNDCQTGRFWQVDPLAEEYLYNSTYAFSENKVTTHVELEGLEAVRFDASNYPNRGESTQLPRPRLVKKSTVRQQAPVFSLLVTQGKQFGFKIAGFGGHINAGSKEILSVNDSDPGTNTADKSKTHSGGSLSLGLVSASKETTAGSTDVKNQFGTVTTITKTDTERSMTVGLKKTPLEIGIYNTENMITSSNGFTENSVASTTGPQILGSTTPSDVGFKSGKKATEFSVSFILKVEVQVNMMQFLSNIFESLNRGGF